MAAGPLIVGNWEMHGRAVDLQEIRALAASLRGAPTRARVVVCPPATLLAPAGSWRRMPPGARRPTLIIYGGSVTPQNAGEIAGLSGVDGLLAGCASMKAADFLAVIRAAAGIKRSRSGSRPR